MSDDKVSERVAFDLNDVNFPKLYRIGEKINALLIRKIKDPLEAYLLLKMLCYSIEDSQGIKMTPEDEANFRKMVIEEPLEPDYEEP